MVCPEAAMLMWPSDVLNTPVGMPVGWSLPAWGGTEVLHHHVRLGGEALDDVHAARRLEIEGERALVAVEIEGVEAAADEVALGVLTSRDLDHLGPHVGELADAGGAGARPREVN